MNELFTEWVQLIRCTTLKPNQIKTLGILLDYNNLKINGKWNNTPLIVIANDLGVNISNAHKLLKGLVDIGLVIDNGRVFRKCKDFSPNVEAIRGLIHSSKRMNEDGSHLSKKINYNSNLSKKISENTNTDDSNLSKKINYNSNLSKKINYNSNLSKKINYNSNLSKKINEHLSKKINEHLSKKISNTNVNNTKEKKEKENNIYSYNPIMDLKESMDSINENEINNKLGLDDSMDYSPNNDNQNQNDNNKLGLEETLVDNPNNGVTNPIDGIKTFDSFDSSEGLGMSETAETCEDETNEWNKKDTTNEVNHTVQDSHSPLQGESKVELNNNNLGLEKSDYSPNGVNPNQNDNKENRNNPNHSNGETEPTIGNMQTSDNSESVGLVDSPSGTIPKANNTSKGQYRPNLDYISKMEAIALGNPTTTETTTAYPTSEELDGLVLCNLDTQSKRNGAATKIIQGAQRIGTLHSTLLRMNEWLVQRIQDPNEDMALAYHAAINTFDDFEERMSNGQRNLFVMDLNQVYNNLKTAGYTVWDNYTPPKEYNTKDTQSKVVF